MLELSFGIIYPYLLKNYLHGIRSKMGGKNIICSLILQLGCYVFRIVCLLLSFAHSLRLCALWGVGLGDGGAAALKTEGCWLPF